MNDAKRLTLEEIEALPIGSVVWYEQHVRDDDEQYAEFYSLYPALVAEPGKNGTICWAGGGQFDIMTIDNTLINEDRFFWNAKPDRDMITRGIPDEAYNNLMIYPKTEVGKRLMLAITYRGYEIGPFCQLCGLDESTLTKIITGEKEALRNEIEAIIEALQIDDSKARSIFFPDLDTLAAQSN